MAAVRVTHLNCVSFCPPGRRLIDGREDAAGPAMLSCHCLLVEIGERLVLVDTGYGVQDVRHPRPRLSPLFLDVLCRPRLWEETTAVRQIERMGHRAEDVTDIVLTHLDFDHAGGLDDFPRARVHMLESERRHARARRSFLDRQRFRPLQWQTSIDRWRTYEPKGERWFGFDAVREMVDVPPEILLVPLIGHTMGHAGVAIQTGGESWLLHCGDAYFHHGELNPGRYECPPGLRFYQWFMEVDRDRRLKNQARLRELANTHSGKVRVFSAHDPEEFEALRAGGSVARPASAPEPAPISSAAREPI